MVLQSSSMALRRRSCATKYPELVAATAEVKSWLRAATPPLNSSNDSSFWWRTASSRRFPIRSAAYLAACHTIMPAPPKYATTFPSPTQMLSTGAFV